jgi:3-deoxy-D-manno-octulosonate 8-phosphate phosphatase (KDO 8-P phosphatase)
MKTQAMITTDPSQIEPLQAIVIDVDGTLTDGSIWLGPRGEEFKRFDVRDGLGVIMALNAGLKVFLFSSRQSEATRRRGQELGVTEVVFAYPSKIQAFDDLLSRHHLGEDQVCYIGDDLTDLVPIKSTLLGVAVGDAHEDLKEAADLVCESRGGMGAVRETIELILRIRGVWEELVQRMDPDYVDDL